MAEFLSAHSQVEINEGGFSNDSADIGGFTYCGITRKNFPNWVGWRIIDAHMPLEHGEIIEDVVLKGYVKNFYKVNFWDKIQGDSIDSQAIATFIYDWFVNSGQDGIKAIQRALAIPSDGIIGMVTVTAINRRNEAALLQLLKDARIQFCRAIVARKPSQKRFLQGWLNRIERLA